MFMLWRSMNNASIARDNELRLYISMITGIGSEATYSELPKKLGSFHHGTLLGCWLRRSVRLHRRAGPPLPGVGRGEKLLQY